MYVCIYVCMQMYRSISIYMCVGVSGQVGGGYI